ncbi:MAG TPA: tripartite tricarboxylate transporter substrate binding protein [Usitatibacter sp.]|nr:tripartite tricarboxylate transporter substrate binding protein [Usitatibacter sp.]
MRSRIIGKIVTVLAAFAACIGIAVPAAAQGNYPSKTVRIVVGYGPGTTSDVFARLIAKGLSERWHQTVIVENRPGAAGAIGADYVAKSAPDGYTLMLISNAFTLGPMLQRSLPYDPFKDFIPITQVAQTPNIFLASKKLGISNLKEFMALARKAPGGLQYSSSGRGTPSQISVELFKSMAGLHIEEIPYKDSNQAFTDVISGVVSLNAPGLAQGLPYVAAGRVVTLGITGSKRSPAAPDVPTLAEAGLPGYEAYGWHGIFAPAGTPPQLVAFLNKELVATLNDPGLKAMFVKQGAEIVASSPQEFTAFLKTDYEKWKKLFNQIGIKPE